MKKYHRKPQEELTDEPALEISSLIDVCFLLLIYFIVTTTIQPREQDLKMAIAANGGTSFVMPPMLIELRKGGAIAVNPGDAVEFFEANLGSRVLPSLKIRLQSIASLGRSKTPQVILKVHDDVLQQRYIDVLNCLSGAGIQDIALQN